MTLRVSPAKGASVVEGSPAEAAPGDELLWASEGPDGPVHHSVGVGVVLHDPNRGHVRVVARDGAELDFAADRVVVLVRGAQGVLARGRASDGVAPPPVAVR